MVNSSLSQSTISFFPSSIWDETLYKVRCDEMVDEMVDDEMVNEKMR